MRRARPAATDPDVLGAAARQRPRSYEQNAISPWLSQGLPSLARVPVNPPAVLGRGVVVNAGDPVPQPWAGAPEVVVDDDALADPAGVVALLHEAWAARRAWW